MPLIPFPNVPAYSGVPALARQGTAATTIAITLGTVQNLLTTALQSAPTWGIFNAQSGAQFGLNSQGTNGLFSSLVQAALGQTGPVLSTNAFEFVKESKISTFPVENGGFAAYNKVKLPSRPTVTLALTGAASDRATFLTQLDLACDSTTLFNIVTPEKTYKNFAMERYNMIRRAERGATLIMVEISLLQIRQISAALSSTATTPINTPQNSDATSSSNGGIVQPQTPNQSTLNSLASNFPNLGSN